MASPEGEQVVVEKGVVGKEVVAEGAAAMVVAGAEAAGKEEEATGVVAWAASVAAGVAVRACPQELQVAQWEGAQMAEAMLEEAVVARVEVVRESG